MPRNTSAVSARTLRREPGGAMTVHPAGAAICSSSTSTVAEPSRMWKHAAGVGGQLLAGVERDQDDLQVGGFVQHGD